MATFLVLVVALLVHMGVETSVLVDPPATRPAATQPIDDASWHGRIAVDWELSKEERERSRDVEFSDRYWDKRKDLTKEEAFAILLRTRTVADVAVGITGETPPQFYAMGLLLRQPNARAVFADLHERAGPAGKVYALCALRDLNRNLYEQGLQALRESDAQVGTLQGCIGGDMPLRDVLDDEAGFLDPDKARGEGIKSPFDRRAILWTRYAREKLD